MSIKYYGCQEGRSLTRRLAGFYLDADSLCLSLRKVDAIGINCLYMLKLETNPVNLYHPLLLFHLRLSICLLNCPALSQHLCFFIISRASNNCCFDSEKLLFALLNIFPWNSRDVDLWQFYRSLPHVCYFVLDVAFFCLLRYDLKLKVNDWPLNTHMYSCFVVLHTSTRCKQAGVDTEGPLFVSWISHLTFTCHQCVTLAYCRPTRTD